MGRRRFNDSPISAKKDELAKKEEELRREMEELQRKIEEAPKLAQAEQERQRQERIARASTRRSPFDSPDILQDSRHGEDLFSERPRRPAACTTAPGAHASTHLLSGRPGSRRDRDLPRDSNV